MSKVVMVVLLVLVASVANCQMTVMNRTTSEGHQDLGFITNFGELYGFNLDQSHPIIEAGKLVKVGEALMGGYLSYWSSTKELYAEPFAILVKDAGKIRFKVKPFAYLPLNGGSAAIGTDEASLTYRVNDEVRVGFIAQYWQTSGQDAMRATGLQVEWKVGSKTYVTVRDTHGDLGQVRLALFRSF